MSFELESVQAADGQGPVVMLNLLKFRPTSLDGDGTGRDAYRRYGDPDYLAANEHRVNGVERHLIVATKTHLLEGLPEPTE